MENLDPILFEDGHNPDDPASRARARRWMALLRKVGADVDASLPDRRLLVLEGMRRFGGEDFLAENDARELSSAAPQLNAALERHPALEDVVEDVRNDCALFDRCWLDVVSGRSPATPRSAADRRPIARRTGVRWAWRIGAGVAVVAFAAIVFFIAQRDAGLSTIATGPDQIREVTLADGSHVRLLPNSELQFHSEDAPSDRFARLNGDAFFEIAPDREGFTIELPTAVAVVLGTSFGIQASEERADVFLATGRLAVTSEAARDRPVVLEPGQTTRVVRNAPPTAPQFTDITHALDWTGLLVFRETRVEVVAERLTESFETEIRADSRLANETLSGTFDRADGIDVVLQAIASALDATVVVSDDARTITPR